MISDQKVLQNARNVKKVKMLMYIHVVKNQVSRFCKPSARCSQTHLCKRWQGCRVQTLRGTRGAICKRQVFSEECRCGITNEGIGESRESARAAKLTLFESHTSQRIVNCDSMSKECAKSHAKRSAIQLCLQRLRCRHLFILNTFNQQKL